MAIPAKRAIEIKGIEFEGPAKVVTPTLGLTNTQENKTRILGHFSFGPIIPVIPAAYFWAKTIIGKDFIAIPQEDALKTSFIIHMLLKGDHLEQSALSVAAGISHGRQS